MKIGWFGFLLFTSLCNWLMFTGSSDIMFFERATFSETFLFWIYELYWFCIKNYLFNFFTPRRIRAVVVFNFRLVMFALHRILVMVLQSSHFLGIVSQSNLLTMQCIVLFSASILTVFSTYWKISFWPRASIAEAVLKMTLLLFWCYYCCCCCCWRTFIIQK